MTAITYPNVARIQFYIIFITLWIYVKYILSIIFRKGYTINVASICGGLAQSDLFIQTNSDVLQLNIVRPHQVESVLLGAAMLGAAASKADKDTKSSKRYFYWDKMFLIF